MAATVFAFLGLCLVFIAQGLPVDVNLVSRPSAGQKTKPAPKGTNAKQLGGGFEGDMIFPNGFDPTDPTRGVAKYGTVQWPSGIIPYDISAITNSRDRQTITDAMQTLMYAVGTPIANSNERKACVFFRPRQSTDKTYFKIQYGGGCSANVGYYANQPTEMTLAQDGCFYSGTIQHELMHVLGFYHEQSRPDRDSYLIINLDNVEPDMRHNFDKYTWGSTVLNQGSSYDYSSIMHYETTAFSMNGRPTMTPRRAGVTIGDAEELSGLDIAEIRHFYGCTA